MKLSRLIYLVLACALLGGCKDDYDPSGSLHPSLNAHYLSVSQSSFYRYTAQAFSEDFNIESVETPWTFEETPYWITLSPDSGVSSSTVTLAASANTSAEEARTGIFYLSSDLTDWTYRKALTVSQGKADAILVLGETYVSLPGSSSSATVKVVTNCAFTVSSSQSWLSASVVDNSIKVTASANPLDTYRSAFVYVSYGNSKTASFTVRQSPSEITASSYTLVYENTASKYDVEIDSEADWTAIVSDSWINVSPSSGEAGITHLAIEVAPNSSVNSRKGAVSILTDSNVRMQISVEQKGMYIEADESLEFSASAETKTLSIRSNTSWEVESAPNWVSLSKTKGEGNSEVSVTSVENPGTVSRTGEVVLGHAGLSIKSIVKIYQTGKYFTADTPLLEFSDKASSADLRIETDASWSSVLSADWFHANPLSGNGNATVSISVDENNSTEERTGTIEYSFAGEISNVIVHQLSKYFTLDAKTFEFDSKGGSHAIDISTNENWTATIENNVDWLSISKTSGSGSATIILTAEENPSVNTRSTVLVITPEYSQAIRILVSQKPRYLSLSTQNILFFADGGTSEPVTVSTDGTYEISSDASWFTISSDSNDTFTVYATKNTSNEVRRGVITVKMTDLKEGSLEIELPVVQAGQGGTFILTGYPEDTDWDIVSSGNISISIKGYVSDSNWDMNSGCSLTIKVTGYSTEQDWNRDDRSNGHVTISAYGKDVNWSEPVLNDGSFQKSNYNKDIKWNN